MGGGGGGGGVNVNPLRIFGNDYLETSYMQSIVYHLTCQLIYWFCVCKIQIWRLCIAELIVPVMV